MNFFSFFPIYRPTLNNSSSAFAVPINCSKFGQILLFKCFRSHLAVVYSSVIVVFLGGRRDVCSVLTSSLEDMQLHIGLNRKSPLADKVCINSYLCYRLLLLMIIIIQP